LERSDGLKGALKTDEVTNAAADAVAAATVADAAADATDELRAEDEFTRGVAGRETRRGAGTEAEVKLVATVGLSTAAERLDSAAETVLVRDKGESLCKEGDAESSKLVVTSDPGLAGTFTGTLMGTLTGILTAVACGVAKSFEGALAALGVTVAGASAKGKVAARSDSSDSSDDAVVAEVASIEDKGEMEAVAGADTIFGTNLRVEEPLASRGPASRARSRAAAAGFLALITFFLNNILHMLTSS
jgi:hypothetical protein